MRLLCPSTAMILSVLDVEDISPLTTRGKGGQTSSVSFAGVSGVQKSRRFKRCGDPRTRPLHRRDTCTSECHASIPPLPLSHRLVVSMYKSNITSRTSSGSTSIDWIRSSRPTSHHVSQQSCGMWRNERHTILPLLYARHLQAFRTAIDWKRYPGAARKWWRGEGGTGVW